MFCVSFYIRPCSQLEILIRFSFSFARFITLSVRFHKKKYLPKLHKRKLIIARLQFIVSPRLMYLVITKPFGWGLRRFGGAWGWGFGRGCRYGFIRYEVIFASSNLLLRQEREEITAYVSFLHVFHFCI